MPKGIYIRTKEYREKARQRNLGEKSHFWKGGLTSDMKKYQKEYQKKKIQRLRRYKRKQSCYFCHYNKCPDALDFHHLQDKDHSISFLTKYRWKKIKKELKKCIPICCRCHRELHAGLLHYPLKSQQ